MEVIKNIKQGNKDFIFKRISYSDYILLSQEEKNILNGCIDDIFRLISYNSKQIERCPNDILLTCQDKSKIVGFIHIVPQNYNCENLSDRYNTKKMHIDYIAVAPQYQGLGIATALYKLCAKELKKNGTKELSAVLFDEYSRRAFCKAMGKSSLKLKESVLDGVVSAIFEDKQMEM